MRSASPSLWVRSTIASSRYRGMGSLSPAAVTTRSDPPPAGPQAAGTRPAARRAGSRTSKVGALPELAGDRDAAAVGVHDRLGDRQPEADAGDGVGQHGAAAEELVKILPSSASEMPRPVSRTRTTATSPSRPTVPSTWPPAGVYLMALLNRLSKTWASRSAVAVDVQPCRTSSVSSSSSRPAARRGLARLEAEPLQQLGHARPRSMSSTWSTDCSAVESRSSTSRCSRRALRCTT